MNANDSTPLSTLRGDERRLAAAREGFKNNLPKGLKLRVGDQNMTVAEIEAELARRQKLFSDARETHAVLHEMASRKKAEEASTREFLTNVKFAVANHVGRTNASLLDFGFTPEKKRKGGRPRKSGNSQPESKPATS